MLLLSLVVASAIAIDEDWLWTCECDLAGTPALVAREHGVVDVAFETHGTIEVRRLDADGEEMWMRSIPVVGFPSSPGIVAMSGGRLGVAAKDNKGMHVWILAPDGSTLGEATIEGFYTVGFFLDRPPIATDGDDVYVAGFIDEVTTISRIAADGAIAWTKTHEIDDDLTYGTSLCVDPMGRLTLGGACRLGCFATRFDGAGEVVWQRIETGGLGEFFPLGPTYVTAGEDGSVSVVGTPESTCGLFSALTWKHDADGAFLWRRLVPEWPCDQLMPAGLVADGDFVVSAAEGTDDQVHEYRMRAYRMDASGELTWSFEHDAPGSVDQVNGVAIDDGVVYLAGTTSIAGQDRDIETLAIDSRGDLVWSASWTSPNAINDIAHGVDVDEQGNVSVAITTFLPALGGEVGVLRYATGCAADVNGDGALDILDFVEFQALFVAGAAAADCDDDDVLTILDFLCYQTSFVKGCG